MPIKMNRYTTEEALVKRAAALAKLKRLGYPVERMLDSDQCRCCVPTNFDLYGNRDALEAWETFETFDFLAGPVKATPRPAPEQSDLDTDVQALSDAFWATCSAQGQLLDGLSELEILKRVPDSITEEQQRAMNHLADAGEALSGAQVAIRAMLTEMTARYNDPAEDLERGDNDTAR